MIYKEWKAERQAAMDARPPGKLAIDRAYQQANRSDAFYYGLESKIKERQQAKAAEQTRDAQNALDILKIELRDK